MSLITMRLNEKKKNAFLSDCFNFVWLGKYKVDLHFTKGMVFVFYKNFNFLYDENNIPYVVSTIGETYSKSFFNANIALDFFNLLCYTLISDFAIKSQDDFDEFFDLNRIQGFNEWLPELHRFFK